MLEQWFGMSGSLETYQGTGANGDVYAAAVSVSGFLDDAQVRQQTANGIEFVDQTKWYGPLSDASLFTVGSRITVNGRRCVVQTLHRRQDPGLGLPEHIEVDVV